MTNSSWILRKKGKSFIDKGIIQHFNIMWNKTNRHVKQNKVGLVLLQGIFNVRDSIYLFISLFMISRIINFEELYLASSY